MGADMIMTYVAHRVGVTPSLNAAAEWIESLRPSDLINNLDAYAFEQADIANDPNNPETLTQVKKFLLTGIQETLERLTARDVAYFVICGWECYFTGGMSWGDTPGDSYESFSLLQDAGNLGDTVLEKAGFGFPPQGIDRYQIQEEASLVD